RSEHTRRNRKQQTFSQQLPYDASTSRAQRESQRDLFTTPNRTRQQQPGNIRARDQQYKSNRDEQHDQRPTRIAHKLIAHRHHDDADLPSYRLVWMVHRNPAHDGVHVSLRLRHGHAGLQTRHHRQIVTTAIGPILLRESDRNPHAHVLRKKLKTRRHHANNRMLLAIQQDLAIENVSIAAIATLPESIAEHDCFASAGSIFIRRKTATEQWLHAEKWKEVGRNRIGGNAFRLTIAREIEAGLTTRSH